MSVLHILLDAGSLQSDLRFDIHSRGSFIRQNWQKKLIVTGWVVYALIYLGFALAKTAIHVGLLYTAYGFYYGLTYGTAKAMVGDLIPEQLRGTAYGTYNAILGIWISRLR